MNLFSAFRDQSERELDAPPSRYCRVFQGIFLIYIASFVFDYKSVDLGFGAASTGGSPMQFAFLGIALLSGATGSILGVRYLLTRPGVYMVALWWGYTAFAIAVALLSGNEMGRILRLLIPSLLVGFGVNLTMICACTGTRPSQMGRWFVLAGLTNVLWNIVLTLGIRGVPLTEVRMDILSPAMRFLFAWSACALLLRHRFSPWILVVFGLPLAVAALSITRSMAFPLFASFSTAAFCLFLGLLWRMYDLRHLLRKSLTLVGFGFAALGIIAIVIVAMPAVTERWAGRLFDNRGQGGATTEDLSSLMRKAEAEAMWEILAHDPHRFIYGMGLGASYYWDEDYYPELFLVYPEDRHQFPFHIFSAGHSIWTYALFSRGFVGVFLTLAAFSLAMGMSLWSGFLNSRTVMGPRAWDSFLIFFPFVSMWAMMGESITRNPFDERFTGVLFGVLLAFPQFFFNRACYLRFREKRGEEVAQLILDVDDVPAEYESPDPRGNREPRPGHAASTVHPANPFA